MIASLGMLPSRPVLFRGPATLRSVSRVRRALFRTADDVEDSLEFVRNEQLELARRDREKYNFDFETETPINGGRYVWEHGATHVRTIENPEPEIRPTEEVHKPTTSESSLKVSGKLNQKKISDYWSNRKRHSSSPVHKTAASVSSEDVNSRPAKVQRTASS